jgi:hypothetical protein
MESDRIQLKLFCFSILILCVMEGMGSLIITSVKGHSVMVLGGIRLMESILLLGMFKWREGGLSALGLGQDQIISGLKRGILWALGFGVLVLAIGIILFLIHIPPLKLLNIQIPQAMGDRIVFFIVAGVISPAAEEIVFRGILYGFLRRWGTAPALFISASLFALLHSGAGLTQAVGGLLFGISYELEGKLLVPITVHALGNLAMFSLPLIA